MFLEDMLVEAETISENAVSENTVSSNVVAQISDAIAEGVGVDNIDEKLNIFQQYMTELPNKLIKYGIRIAIAILIFIIGSKIISGIRRVIKKGFVKKSVDAGVIQFLDSFIKVILYTILILFIAGTFGIQTTGIAALIGSAGVAFALALQGSLSNFIGGVLILILRPFKVGDYIVEHTKNSEGTVIAIQLFYTKLRTVDDRIVILPNGDLANTSITNITMSPIRRVCLSVGISYDSDIRKAKSVIRDVIEKDECVLKDSVIDVYVDSLDDSAVTIGFRYYVKNEDYWTSRWENLENIKYALDENEITIPFNQLDVHVNNQ